MLTLAEFFDGNDVDGSIGCNLPALPTPAQMRAVLEDIASRQEVADVRVVVAMFDDPEWPIADRVWIITTASANDVARWFPGDLAPDEVDPGGLDGIVREPVDVSPGYRAVVCWWD